jgi:hypothetical protein
MIKFLALLIFKPISIGANNIIENGTIKSLFTTFTFFWFINSILVVLHGGYVKYSNFLFSLSLDRYIGFNLFPYIFDFIISIVVSLLLACLCWANFNLWLEINFTKLFKVSLIISCLQQIPSIIRSILLYLVQFLSFHSPFWTKIALDSLKTIVNLSEIYILFLFIVLLYKLTKVNRIAITLFAIVVFIGIAQLQNIIIKSIS